MGQFSTHICAYTFILSRLGPYVDFPHEAAADASGDARSGGLVGTEVQVQYPSC